MEVMGPLASGFHGRAWKLVLSTSSAAREWRMGPLFRLLPIGAKVPRTYRILPAIASASTRELAAARVLPLGYQAFPWPLAASTEPMCSRSLGLMDEKSSMDEKY